MINIEGHTFNPDNLNSDSLVIDIGGNDGVFSQGLLQLQCRVICYEPDRSAFAYLKNLIKSDKFTVINKAVAETSGKRKFYSASPMNGGNSLIFDSINRKIIWHPPFPPWRGGGRRGNDRASWL